MKGFEVAIIENDDKDLEQLRAHIEKYSDEHGVSFHIACFAYGEAFLSAACRPFDLVFMDVQLMGMDGLETSRKFRESNPFAILIIVTNTEQYAIKGYEVDADDFILKPVNYALFESKLSKALSRLFADDTSVMVTVRQREGVMYVPARNIYYVEVADHNLVYHTINGNISAYGSLNKVEAMLLETGFIRCSAWCLVNVRYIEGLYGEDIKLYNNDVLRIGRSKRREFLAALAHYRS